MLRERVEGLFGKGRLEAVTPKRCASRQPEAAAVALPGTGTAEAPRCVFCNALNLTAAIGSQVSPAFLRHYPTTRCY